MAQIQILEGFDLQQPRTRWALGVVGALGVVAFGYWWWRRSRDNDRVEEILELTRPRGHRSDSRYARRRRVAEEELDEFGDEAEEALRQAFVASDDGDCARVTRELGKAARAGVDVTVHRKQLLADCRLRREG